MLCGVDVLWFAPADHPQRFIAGHAVPVKDGGSTDTSNGHIEQAGELHRWLGHVLLTLDQRRPTWD